ncbi:hypothetical protein CH306_22970 [Rhodococcus sp. 15-725-2-2b]|uniref:hypothetical protein n=1 Tax=unclassified Rhodococcus (in: high G+C Gram-positive bacteria) TaxID=192944 RepID=UPI000B9AA41E|nr:MULTISPECIES: hypothetical protein [unclassified Rhodococcus (in: high G+C Gram-positive bacteria)]OZC71750.1 hypothetical protein CH277_04405 [Rhodococcus sp. 06-469-3-2]OZD42539.1 hypothetical protein CH264_21820 [Rhodococcus sp. 06-1477-1A]OZE68246.1 hypothetical protein CH306_22970 [Rhodococcus sp. 15-725-2-2b]
MNITQYKQQIVDELEAIGVTVFAGGMRKQAPPYVQLYPAQNYIDVVKTTIGKNDFNIMVTFNLSIIAGPEDKDSTLDHLNSLTSKCLFVVKELDDVQVTSFVAVDQNGGRLLASNIAFSNTLNIQAVDL